MDGDRDGGTMSRAWIAEEILTLERIKEELRESLGAFVDSVKADVKTIAFHLDGPTGHSRLSNEIATTVGAVRGVAESASTAVQVSILTAHSELKAALWTTPLPEGSTGGHLREHPDGEPLLIQLQRFVPAPLTVPAVIDMNVALQRGVVGDCFFVGSLRHLAAAEEQLEQRQRLTSMGVPDPKDPDNYVLVKVAAGEYRLRATLPWDDYTNAPAGVTSLDRTTLVPYIEKAAAAHFGALKDLEGGRPQAALGWLVGERSVEHVEHAAKLSDEGFAAALNHPGCIVSVNFTFHRNPPDAGALAQSGLVEGHAYNLADLDIVERTVALADPLDTLDNQRSLDFETLRKLNVELTWIKGLGGVSPEGGVTSRDG